MKSAAILLFGKNVNRYFPAVEFKIGRFHSSESDLITQDVIEGNIIQMADQVVRILKAKYLISPIRYEGMQRIEELEIPEKALREIIYNAIVHKDYTGPSIQMRVYDDKVEIWNYGMLPEEITPEMLMRNHSSHPRNKNVARAFFKAGFIESWGRGFKKIREETGDIVSANGRVNVRVKTPSDGTQLTNRQQVICALIKDNPFVTAKEMSEKLSVAERTVFRDLSVLQKSNIIRHEGGDKTGVWVILE